MKISKKTWDKYRKKMSLISEKAASEMNAWIMAQGGYEMIEFEGKRLHEWLFDIMSPDELQPELDTGWLELEVGEAEQ